MDNRYVLDNEYYKVNRYEVKLEKPVVTEKVYRRYRIVVKAANVSGINRAPLKVNTAGTIGKLNSHLKHGKD